MTKMLLDTELRSRLNALNEHVEFFTEDGKIVGHFLPDAFYRQLVYAWANAQVTDEQLEQASQEPGGRTLEGIL